MGLGHQLERRLSGTRRRAVSVCNMWYEEIDILFCDMSKHYLHGMLGRQMLIVIEVSFNKI